MTNEQLKEVYGNLSRALLMLRDVSNELVQSDDPKLALCGQMLGWALEPFWRTKDLLYLRIKA